MRENQAIQRMREIIRRQHKALATEANDVHGLRHYLAALREMPPALSSERKLQRFLTELALKRDVAAALLRDPPPSVCSRFERCLGLYFAGYEHGNINLRRLCHRGISGGDWRNSGDS